MKKGVSIAVIFFFISVSFIPIISGNINESRTTEIVNDIKHYLCSILV